MLSVRLSRVEWCDYIRKGVQAVRKASRWLRTICTILKRIFYTVYNETTKGVRCSVNVDIETKIMSSTTMWQALSIAVMHAVHASGPASSVVAWDSN